MAKNLIQRSEFGTWKPMNRVVASGVDEQSPRLVKNAAYDQFGALMPLGATTTGSPGVIKSSAAYPADMDDLGLVAFLDDLDLSTLPNAWLYGLGLGSYGATVTQAMQAVNAAAGTQYASPGLFEGVGYGHCPKDATAAAPAYSYLVLTPNVQIYTSSVNGHATIVLTTPSDASSTLNAVEHHVLALSCIVTANGLFVVGADQKKATPAAGQNITATPSWSTVSGLTGKPYVILYFIRESTATEYRIFASTQSLSAFPMAYIPGVANDPLPDGSVAYAMNFYGEGDNATGELSAVAHERRFYALSGRMQTFHSNGGSSVEAAARQGSEITALNARVQAGRTVVFSEIGYVNFAASSNWFDVPFTGQDERITGMLSTPAGLLIFGRHEMFLSRGDPLSSGWQLQRVSGTLGSDSSSLLKRPRRAGGTAFFINNGRLMSQAFGMGDVDFGGKEEDLTAGITDPSFANDEYAVDCLIVVPEMRSLAYLMTGSTYRSAMIYSFDTKTWSQDFARLTPSVMLRPILSGGGSPFEYVTYGATHVWTFPFLWPPDVSTTSYQITVEFDDIALGDRDAWKLWKALELFTNDSVTAISVAYTPSDGAAGSFAMASEGQDVWRGFFPMGLVSRRLSSLTLTFTLTGSGRVYPKMGLYAAARQRFH